jgi:hypothetical protein
MKSFDRTRYAIILMISARDFTYKATYEIRIR